MTWKDDQEFEKGWWDNCCNTFGEEQKQMVYARLMGLTPEWDYGHYPVYQLKDISVCDIGGGPVSLLLKCKDVDGLIVDPCDYPKWIDERYKEADLGYRRETAEDFKTDCVFDEAWIYNVLQHTINPEKIIKNMKSYSKIIRVFEWIDEPISEGHPQFLTQERLNKAFGGFGHVEDLNESGCHGRSYSGIFLGDHYAVSST